MQKTIYIVLFLLTSCRCMAQVSGGFVTVDSIPIAGATVLLLNSKDNSVVATTLTDEQGKFKTGTNRNGSYYIRLSTINFQPWNSSAFELSDIKPSKDVGIRAVKNEIKSLSEVTIQFRKPLLEQIEAGIIINVEAGMLNKGSSALEVLERSPGVVINQRNNSISLNGKTGVAVMIDGKLMRMSMDQLTTFLSGINANDIDNIELFSTPPSKYDAEGNAGIINIKMKKNKKAGTTINTSISGGYGQGEKAVASLQLGQRTAKVNISSSYTFSRNRSYHWLSGDSHQNFPPLGGPLTVQFKNFSKPTRNIHDASVGIDLYLRPKITIGASLDYNTLSFIADNDNQRWFTILPDSLLLFNGVIHSKNRSQNIRSSVYIERQINEGETFSTGVDYLYFKNNNPSSIQSSFTDKNGNQTELKNDTLFAPVQRGFAETLVKVGIGKIDYSKKLNNRLKLETGLKGNFTQSTGFSRIESLVSENWINRGETSNNTVMKENIGAVYATLNLSPDTANTFDVGLRYEYSRTHADDRDAGKTTIDRRLSVLFPSVSFSHKVSDNEAWQLSYTKRIGRPSYNDLSSFVTYNDPITVFTGNPLLKPTITQVIRAGYQYRKYSFSLSLSRDNNPIAQYQLTESPQKNLMYISPQNVSYQNNIVFQSDLSHQLTSWWTISSNFVVGWRQFQEDYTLYPLKESFVDYSVSWNQLFLLPGQLSLELSGFYNSSSYTGTVKTEKFGTINTGIKKDLKNKGTLQLSVYDILGTIKYKNYYGMLTREAFNGESHATFNPESRKSPIIMLTYSMSLGGKGKAKQKNKEEIESKRIRTD
jgi:iron complex outermembrane recepter protein